jgi:hypothetical protein
VHYFALIPHRDEKENCVCSNFPLVPVEVGVSGNFDPLWLFTWTKSPKGRFLEKNCVVWDTPRYSPSSCSICACVWGTRKKCKDQKGTCEYSISVVFAGVTTELKTNILASQVRSWWHYQACRSLCQSAESFKSYRGSTLGISHSNGERLLPYWLALQCSV